MVKSVLVPLAKGFEEIELVSIVDILRRAELRVVMASLDSHKRVLGAHHIVIEADSTLPELEMEDFDAIALAGGYDGMCNLANNELVKLWLHTFKQSQKLIAAICASPIVLDKAGVLEGDFTCYPSCEEQINMQGKKRISKAVVKNGKVITSMGPATASVFALSLVKELCGEENAKILYEQLQMPSLKTYLQDLG
ncbi:DJ-1 family glyoxalase III [Helicobacter marmotae]|uniref:DJ-1 family protein n=1 Tax=Helicobacter marmotae TaxID=152490 RepID=A0A3D8I4H0_9HELI|nr:DJ-1 family glyoxalase III [Helicobacter marmotae]RDU60029.1 DJ-1 family protein [Helicobacter marmotae]